jgi:type I restriction enzyme, S subunit
LDLKSKQQSHLIKEYAEFNPENIGKDFQFSEIHYLDTSSVTEGKITDIQILQKSDAPSRAKRRVKENDIIISTVRPNLKHYYFVKNPQENLVVSTGFVVIRPTNVNPLYLYYYLTTPSFIEYLSGIAYSHTSGYPSFLPEIIEEAEISLPDTLVQEQIGKTLNDLDTKIQNLQNQNKILEQISRAIFKSWFVDFDGVTEWDDSEFGKIPKGWSIGNFSDIIDEIESGKRPKGGINSLDSEIPSIGAENIIGLGEYNYLKTKFISSDFFKVMKKGKIKEKDVLVYKDGASLGRSSLFRNGFPFQKCCINEHVFILRPSEKISSSFLFFWIDQDFMKQEIKNLNSNSAQPGISKPKVLSLPILIPEINMNKKFEILIEPLLAKFFKNILNCNQLIKTREAVLPKLISGEIRV